MKIGLLFGTFNPIHNGHLAIAEYMAENAGLNEVWLIVSPLNPLKKNTDLLKDSARMEMVKLAVEQYPKLRAVDIEFNLPRPSYTINTLKKLREEHPGKSFIIIMGEDNLRNFTQWKEYKKILSDYQIFVYPRKITDKENVSVPLINHPNIKRFTVPLLYVSATQIRNSIRHGKDVSSLLPQKVNQIILLRKYYYC